MDYVGTPEQTRDHVGLGISGKKVGKYKVWYTMHVTQHHVVFLQETSLNSNTVNRSIEDTFTADFTNY
mgnify:FL=1